MSDDLSGVALAGNPAPSLPTGSIKVRGALRNQVGQLWASVFFAPEGKTPKTVLVTSAERSEGSTQVAAALAVLGAESQTELNIVLVDANLHQPSLHSALGLPAGPGLAEVVRGDCSLDDAIRATPLPNLGLVRAGTDLSQPLGLLRSQKLRAMFKDLSESGKVDHIIVDTAAANLFPEAQILAGLADGVVIVTHAGQTRRESVAEAKKRIEQNQGRVLGVVLNQQRYAIPGFIYRRV